jgi:membrane-bound lytic murein transglycosylase D
MLLPVCAVLVLSLTGCPSQKHNPVAAQPQATAPPLPPTAAPQASAEAQNQPSPAEQARILQIVAQVEAAYAAGDADYRKGMLADAKSQFDHAVDVMLSCGIDIRSHPELDSEFEKIVDQVNSLEMEALKQGNGFVPKEEITPAEAASDVTFAVDPNLVAKATAELATTKSDLPLMVNDYVAAFINFFAYTQKGHNTLLHSFQRGGLYKGMIQRVLAEEGVPQDLIYLAVAESGFNPRAVNRRSRAGGMWQFMPDPYYGLTRNSYVDERFDPEKSTLAYARYMKYLYDQLGDWYLAMAAYDHGAGNIQKAVARTGYASFWELYKRHELPKETQNYVPEIIAAIIIANRTGSTILLWILLCSPTRCRLTIPSTCAWFQTLWERRWTRSTRSTQACCAWRPRPTIPSICTFRLVRQHCLNSGWRSSLKPSATPGATTRWPQETRLRLWRRRTTYL